jgi:uncharacterized protein (TIGR03083 family)
MTAADAPATDITRLIAGERRDLAAVLAGLPTESWDSPTLCAGWRVREVVAHITMPFRYRPPRFAAEMIRSRGSFSRMADRCARRDGTAPPSQLAAALRDNEDHPWKPPGGGYQGALTHDVIHGLDITVALGLGRRVPPERLAIVLTASPRPNRSGSSAPISAGWNCGPTTSTGRSGPESPCPARPRISRSSYAAGSSRPGSCAAAPAPGSPG